MKKCNGFKQMSSSLILTLLTFLGPIFNPDFISHIRDEDFTRATFSPDMFDFISTIHRTNNSFDSFMTVVLHEDIVRAHDNFMLIHRNQSSYVGWMRFFLNNETIKYLAPPKKKPLFPSLDMINKAKKIASLFKRVSVDDFADNPLDGMKRTVFSEEFVNTLNYSTENKALYYRHLEELFLSSTAISALDSIWNGTSAPMEQLLRPVLQNDTVQSLVNLTFHFHELYNEEGLTEALSLLFNQTLFSIYKSYLPDYSYNYYASALPLVFSESFMQHYNIYLIDHPGEYFKAFIKTLEEMKVFERIRNFTDGPERKSTPKSKRTPHHRNHTRDTHEL